MTTAVIGATAAAQMLGYLQRIAINAAAGISCKDLLSYASQNDRRAVSTRTNGSHSGVVYENNDENLVRGLGAAICAGT